MSPLGQTAQLSPAQSTPTCDDRRVVWIISLGCAQHGQVAMALAPWQYPEGSPTVVTATIYMRLSATVYMRLSFQQGGNIQVQKTSVHDGHCSKSQRHSFFMSSLNGLLWSISRWSCRQWRERHIDWLNRPPGDAEQPCPQPPAGHPPAATVAGQGPTLSSLFLKFFAPSLEYTSTLQFGAGPLEALFQNRSACVIVRRNFHLVSLCLCLAQCVMGISMMVVNQGCALSRSVCLSD